MSDELNAIIDDVVVETNPSDDKLREQLLPDEFLADYERAHPGQVRVLSVRRYQARVLAEKKVMHFSLMKWSPTTRVFTVSTAPHSVEEFPPTLWALAFHRAAEAMLALRKGHMEHRRDKQYGPHDNDQD